MIDMMKDRPRRFADEPATFRPRFDVNARRRMAAAIRGAETLWAHEAAITAQQVACVGLMR
jgi:hypothetical protein